MNNLIAPSPSPLALGTASSQPSSFLRPRLWSSDVRLWTVLVLGLWTLGFGLWTAPAQTVTTDKLDYAPGEYVTFTGTGWTPGETVNIEVYKTSVDPFFDEGGVTAIADGKGNISNSDLLVQPSFLGQSFLAVATGQDPNETAQVKFTDSPKVGSVSVSLQSPNPVVFPNSTTYTVTVNRGSSSGSIGALSVQLSVTTALPAGAKASFSPSTVSFTKTDNTKTSILTISTTCATPGGSYSFTVAAALKANAADNASGNGTLSVIGDTTPPVIGCPPDKVLACGDSTDPSNTGSATATANCGQAVTISHSDAPTAANCTGKAGIDRMWIATDARGNHSQCLQHITFADTTAPVITCPGDKVLACGDSTDPSNTGTATATDNCGGSVTITQTDTPTSANCTGQAGIDRTWTAEDACHNVSTCVQHITFADTTPPVISCPADKALACGDSTDPANTGSATATDNCGQQVTITYSDAATAANSTGQVGIDRTWKAEDVCHNASFCVQHITFADTTAPVITCPGDKVLACGDSTDPSNTGTATATDNCGGSVTITQTDTPTSANCTGQAGIDRTWTAEDACHNVSTCVQHITFADTTPPIISCPADKTLASGDSTDPSNTGSATATDNCSVSVTITRTDAPTPVNWTGQVGIDRTWKAEDSCHNVSTCVQHITFADTNLPVIICPADKVLACGDSTDPSNTGTATATATDNCDGSVTITYSDAATAANCTGQVGIDRTWKAEDVCHNASFCVQHITFADTTAPVITCPGDKVLACGDSTDPSNTGTATANDNCGQAVTISHSDAATPVNCTGQAGIDRTWRAEDACHNVSTCVQHITFADTIPPLITCPADKVLACGDSTDLSNTGSATATDNCSVSVTITHTDAPTPANCGGQAGIDRTWKAEDSCHNMSTCVQHITFADTTPPLITCPADKVMACGDSTNPANTGSATATDNCGQQATITYSDAATPANCTGQAGIDRTWRAEDVCHNVSTCVQHITFADTTLPVIACPANKTVACGDSTDPSHTGTATATDNCGSLQITFTDSSVDNCPNNPTLITRTWTATDACGNSATCIQYIQVQCCGQCVNQSLITFEGGTNGLHTNPELYNAPANTAFLQALNNSVAGQWGTWTFKTSTNPAISIGFTNLAQRELGGTVDLCLNPGLDELNALNGSGSLGISLTEDGTDTQIVKFFPRGMDGTTKQKTATNTTASVGAWFYTDLESTNASGKAQHDLLNIRGVKLDYMNWYVLTGGNSYPAGTLKCGIEQMTYENAKENQWITNKTWYWITMRYVTSNAAPGHIASLYDSNLNLIYTWHPTATNGYGNPCVINLKAMSWGAPDGGHHFFFDSILTDFDKGVFPLLPRVAH